MRTPLLLRVIRSAVAAAALAGLSPCLGRGQSTRHAPSRDASDTHLTADQIAAYAKLSLAISQARDSAQKLLAQARNATPIMQQQLRDELATRITALLGAAKMSDAEYRRETYLVSTDTSARVVLDQTIAKLTGAPIPGQLVAAPSAAIAVPAGPLGVHLGHIMNAFGDTPEGRGLLPTAMTEARTAAQHAALAARDTGNLDAMKLHAGHVLNAIDPTIIAKGPGLGYGVKRAALGIAMHADLAAKSAGASQAAVMHAGHVAVSARSTVQRADQIVAVAKQIQAATSASAAVSLVSQLVSLTTELTGGRDANADGKVTWQESEGGLQQCDEHARLMARP